jgi:hypothetical protein
MAQQQLAHHVARIEAAIASGQAGRSALVASWRRSARLHRLDPLRAGRRPGVDPEWGALSVAFRLDEHLGQLRKLLQKYRDTPMSLADACILRMSEIHDRHAVLTLDSDFLVYRRHGRTSLALIHPAA